LGAANIIPLAPRWFYGLLELLAMCGCILAYWRLCRRWPHLGLVLAVVPLFFAWRSLFSYFYPVSILVMGAMIELARQRPTAHRHPIASRGSRRLQMAVRVREPDSSLDLSA
jgi:hypothetical protein